MIDKIKTEHNDIVGDQLLNIAAAGVQLIPCIGSFAADAIKDHVHKEQIKRLINWLKSITEKTNEIIEEINSNPLSYDCFIALTEIAIKNHEKERIEHLKNALFNLLSVDRPEDLSIKIIINDLQNLTLCHLKLLILFDDPSKWFEDHNIKRPDVITSSPKLILDIAYPEIKDFNICKRIWKDLYDKDLVSINLLNGLVSENGLFVSRTTQLGKELIRFITNKL